MNVKWIVIVAILVLSLEAVVFAQYQRKIRPDKLYVDNDSDDHGIKNPSTEEQDSPSCRAPNGETGRCVEYDRCTIFASTTQNLGALKRYFCEFSGQVPKVCCPVNRIESPRTSEQIISTRRHDPQTPSSRSKERASRPTQLPEDCGHTKVTGTRIFNGIVSEPGAWPWLAALFLQDTDGPSVQCGGTLISSRHVLTASHCLVDKNGKKIPATDYSVRLGDHDLFSLEDKTEPVEIGVLRIIVHPQYNGRTFHNDIAILVLKQEAGFNKFVQPICLAFEPPMLTDKYDGQSAFVAGWGATSFSDPFSSKLQQVYIPIWNQTSCRETYRNVIPVNENYLCAGSTVDGKDSCKGDSGGPLMLSGGPDARFHLVGVVSFGKTCGDSRYPGVYTNVRNYLEWIRENIS